MKKVRSNSKKRNLIIASATDGREETKKYDDETLRRLLSNPSIDVIWDNEDGTYTALGFRTDIKFKSIV